MTSSKAQSIVVVAGVIALATGVLNTFTQKKQAPSPQFLIGVPGIFAGMWFLAKAEPELGAAFASAAATYAVIGNGGGVFAQVTPKKELDTQPLAAQQDGVHEAHRAIPPRYVRYMVPEAVESSN